MVMAITAEQAATRIANKFISADEAYYKELFADIEKNIDKEYADFALNIPASKCDKTRYVLSALGYATNVKEERYSDVSDRVVLQVYTISEYRRR